METKTQLPEFKGKPIVEIPADIPQANFLEGAFGKAVLEEYQGRASKDYGNANPLNILSYKDGVVKGSNPFAVALVNQIVQEAGLRTATQADLERILRADALPLRGHYEDSALVLRSEAEPNSYLARNLYEQIKERNKKQKLPVMIPLAGLELENDQNSSYGLAFNLKEDAEIIYAPILNKEGNFSSEDVDEKTGLPTKTGAGNRILYTRDSGLSGLYLDGDLDLGSRDDGLADSSGNGRVVLVSAGGASEKILGERLSELQKIKDAQITQIQERYKKAESILLG